MTLLITRIRHWRVWQVRGDIWLSKAALTLPEKEIVEEKDAAWGAADTLLSPVCLSIVEIHCLEHLLNVLSLSHGFGGVWMFLLVVETLNGHCAFYKRALCPATTKWRRIGFGKVPWDSLKLLSMKVNFEWILHRRRGFSFYSNTHALPLCSDRISHFLLWNYEMNSNIY